MVARSRHTNVTTEWCLSNVTRLLAYRHRRTPLFRRVPPGRGSDRVPRYEVSSPRLFLVPQFGRFVPLRWTTQIRLYHRVTWSSYALAYLPCGRRPVTDPVRDPLLTEEDGKAGRITGRERCLPSIIIILRRLPINSHDSGTFGLSRAFETPPPVSCRCLPRLSPEGTLEAVALKSDWK
ncbi:hypothetical protein BHE74_00003871 [Ensete ventricosum]|nr:hypothetical protein BHE74_00003871 [Ensete ventricosum]